jgi:hypothetical protein
LRKASLMGIFKPAMAFVPVFLQLSYEFLIIPSMGFLAHAFQYQHLK